MAVAIRCFARNFRFPTKMNGIRTLRPFHTSSCVPFHYSLWTSSSDWRANQCPVQLVNIDADDYQRQSTAPASRFLWMSILGLFGLKEKEELTGEDRIIHMVKLAKLSQQKGDLKKAEQLFHMALRAAQEIRHEKGVNHIITEMANNAYEHGDFHKAEKLFIETIKNLMSDGLPPDHNAIIHISGKLACLYALIRDDLKASEGFKFCLDQLNAKIEKGVTDFDTLALVSLISGWFGEFLYSRLNYQEALKHFEKSYNTSVQINGPLHEQSLLQLNNMAAAHASTNNTDMAITCVKEAITLAEQNLESTRNDLPCYHLNLANLYLSKFTGAKSSSDNLLKEAESSCLKALKLAKQVDNKEVMFEAKVSLDKIKVCRNQSKS